jgi:hypothetical protein
MRVELDLDELNKIIFCIKYAINNYGYDFKGIIEKLENIEKIEEETKDEA